MPRTSRDSGAPRAGGDDWDEAGWDQDRTQRIPRQQRVGGPYVDPGQQQHDGQRQWHDQPPARGDVPPQGPGRPDGPSGQGPGGRGPRPRYGTRRFFVFLLVIVLAYLAAMAWAVGASWNAIDEVDATPTNADRPGQGSGSNVLLIGTDSRENLTKEQRNELKTGSTQGARADTIMLLHLPDSGDPTLVSLPRDSYVDIPGNGMNKINASYAIGGPTLMVDTVEQATGLRIDSYLEVGFDGFVDVVGAVGGVEMCLPDAVVEERSDLDLPAGCQELEGKDALNYVRMRYADPRGDLGRVERQRDFLSALVSKMTSPATLLNPVELHDAGTATGSSLRRGNDTSMGEMMDIGLAMRSISGGSGRSITVPISDPNFSTPAGSSVLWDEAGAGELFEALRTDAPLTIEP